jgi:hypothetical protein
LQSSGKANGTASTTGSYTSEAGSRWRRKLAAQPMIIKRKGKTNNDGKVRRTRATRRKRE